MPRTCHKIIFTLSMRQTEMAIFTSANVAKENLLVAETGANLELLAVKIPRESERRGNLNAMARQL